MQHDAQVRTPPLAEIAIDVRQVDGGKELWVAKLDAAGSANPISYQGEQWKAVWAIVATNQVVVFALP